jgi:zinc/manganese transport system substrate-binding protein
MSTRLARSIAAMGCALAVAAVTACGKPDEPPGQTETKPITVVASTNVWSSVAAAVGGPEVTVSALLANPGGDPHSYQVSAKDAAALRGAGLVVYNGGGYDDWVEEALGEGGPARVKAVDLRPDEPHGIARQEDEHGHAGGENEHVWYDLPTVAQVAGEIAAQLSQLRPEAKATFLANADAFDVKLDELEAKVSDLGIAHGGKSVVATEPVAHYVLEAAKLTDVTPEAFVDAIEEETDPPAAAVAEIQQVVSGRQVALLVHNPQTETPMVVDLVERARAAGVPVVEMTETLPDGQDYLTWMGNQIAALSAALSR